MIIFFNIWIRSLLNQRLPSIHCIYIALYEIYVLCHVFRIGSCINLIILRNVLFIAKESTQKYKYNVCLLFQILHYRRTFLPKNLLIKNNLNWNIINGDYRQKKLLNGIFWFVLYVKIINKCYENSESLLRWTVASQMYILLNYSQGNILYMHDINIYTKIF